MSNQDVTSEICLLKGNDVARLLNISRAFAYQLMRQGEIPTVRIGNAVWLRKQDLLAYIDHLYNEMQDEAARLMDDLVTPITLTPSPLPTPGEGKGPGDGVRAICTQ